MEFTLVAVLGVISIVVVAAFSERLGLAAPLSLVVVGIALSFIPGVPHPEIEPEWILAGVLPPLLYSAAVNMPVRDFRRDLKAISGLAVVLVVLSTLGAGALFHWLLPEIGWPAAFALGAVISPTDAVAATSVGKKLGLPHRLVTVLEGEGLVNDASALVLLRTAVAAFAGSFSLWATIGEFLYAVAVAVAVGLVVGLLNVRARAQLDDTVLNTAISFVVPFLAYLPAEELHASGVLAVVIAGLVTGHQSPRFLRAQDRIAESTNWHTASFLLESGMFLLMGLSVKTLVDEVRGDGLSVARALTIGLVAALFVMAARMVWVAPMVARMRRDVAKASQGKEKLEAMQERLRNPDDDPEFAERLSGIPPKRLERFEQRITRKSADLEFTVNEHFGGRGGIVLGWAGMRGAITVAAAQTLPEDTPDRAQLILIAFVVAAVTLLLQGLTLPMVIRKVGIPPDDPQRLRDEGARLLTDLVQAAGDVLDDPSLTDHEGRPYSERVVGLVRSDARVDVHRRPEDSAPSEDVSQGRDQFLELRLRVLQAMSDRLLAARSSGTYSSVTLGQAQHMLDVDAARFEQLVGQER
ncbi:cation:proton antiporter [Streptomyces indicus]|uniref:Monovalent cation:H+ antiporter, CPA1 family n=1 Tax=Streptomyces indicus TaxID=417292 RepID=A0A1G8ZLK5_9ACTN|nr:sodium:proton antiporter [Streptomyces indicus]SDK15927.1 monovalent cation:H+ antiporter, CPA1 family [Streptomyces indicus]